MSIIKGCISVAALPPAALKQQCDHRVYSCTGTTTTAAAVTVNNGCRGAIAVDPCNRGNRAAAMCLTLEFVYYAALSNAMTTLTGTAVAAAAATVRQ
jgi:hypothetical protein